MINQNVPHINFQLERPTKSIHYRNSHSNKHENQIDRRNVISYIENNKDQEYFKTKKIEPTKSNVYHSEARLVNSLKHGETIANK